MGRGGRGHRQAHLVAQIAPELPELGLALPKRLMERDVVPVALLLVGDTVASVHEVVEVERVHIVAAALAEGWAEAVVEVTLQAAHLAHRGQVGHQHDLDEDAARLPVWAQLAVLVEIAQGGADRGHVHVHRLPRLGLA